MDNTENINFSYYFDWIQRICTAKNINIDKKIREVKGGKLFCISSDVGDLYLKKTTDFIIDELKFTLKLMELGIINLPEWIGYCYEMKVYLMRDMGGSDLSFVSELNMESLLNMFTSLARIQKNSIQYVESKDFYGVDYRIDTMLKEMNDLPEFAYEMLCDTPYRMTQTEMEKLENYIDHAKIVLEFINTSYIPNTVHHGDLGAYNVRIIDENCIFYDWGCGGVSHPFFDTVRLLYSSRRKFPTDVPAKAMIIDAYLCEWEEYASLEILQDLFAKMEGLLEFYMAYVKYIRAKNLHLSCFEKTELTDDVSLDRRYETTAIYLREFLES